MVTELKVVSVERVSTNSDGEEGDGSHGEATLSDDGTWIGFHSFSSNLIPGLEIPESNPNYGQIYAKNLVTGEVVLVSANAEGVPLSGHAPAISPDGTKIAFQSGSDAYLASDTNGQSDIFLRDLESGEITLVSSNVYGNEGNYSSLSPVYSPDGTKIAFSSLSSNFVAGDTNGATDIFVKDLATGEITRVSTGTNGEQANQRSFFPIFSPDSSKVAFMTYASNLAPNDDNGRGDIYLKELETGQLTLVSTDSDGNVGNEDNLPDDISEDGTRVLFTTFTSNLVEGDTNDALDLLLKDLTTGETTRVSVDTFGQQLNGSSVDARFFPDDESKIYFLSEATNLVALDGNGTLDIFLKDLVTGQVTLLSTTDSGIQANGFSSGPVFLPGAQSFIFGSSATNLVPDDTNGTTDIFLATLQEFDVGDLVQWKVEDGGNGHWYEYVETPLPWEEARADAEGRVFMRMPGYLATITSQAENDFINSITPPNVWAGGSDAEVEGTWRWVGGPEAGQVFWTEANGTITYADWGGQEPNNAWSEPPGEDYLTAHALYADGSWADNGVPPNPNQAFGYLVEYSDPTPVVADIAVGRTEAETLDIEAGFVVRTNPHPSGDAYLQASGAGEQSAYGRFSGEAGLYTLTIGYFDETDGDSTMSVAVNGEVIDQWDWDADPAGAIVTKEAAMKRLITFVELDEGDIITLSGMADGGEPLRTDFLDIREAPPQAGGFLVEAETLEIVKDFQIVTNNVASGRAYLQAGGGPEQIALYDFDGLAGSYDLTIGYYDENDGVSHMSVRVNGVEVDDWLWDSTTGDRIVTDASAAEHVIPGLMLAPGDVIELVGEPDGGEPLRTDFLYFDPVDELLLI
ncbi:lectin-like protein [Alloyangia pacifica]|uniref:WD40-like Beta Propeller Repeat n=1 Tax=Alloyangia pacifica TaxID=311180 RepID=A0A1I6SVK3_9RHOB|nr:lectin-like protein [Alloyangia pacifica]SDG89148.1 WD40-like Beta Propeller Repeat [Alloyangia pacifica]SFS80991.1 WD40-like Beta Propeller Repeat [Alloyangia pacifica]